MVLIFNLDSWPQDLTAAKLSEKVKSYLTNLIECHLRGSKITRVIHPDDIKQVLDLHLTLEFHSEEAVRHFAVVQDEFRLKLKPIQPAAA